MTLLSFNQLCPAKSGRSVLSFTSLDDYRKLLSNEIDPGAVRPVHLIEIPDQFTRRAWVAYERDSQALNEASKRLMQDFFDKRPGGKKP